MDGEWTRDLLFYIIWLGADEKGGGGAADGSRGRRQETEIGRRRRIVPAGCTGRHFSGSRFLARLMDFRSN